MPVHLYNFVTNMPVLMHAADGLVCKAGGLIVTEALACGLPLLLVDVLPGQETGNARYVIDNGVGDLAETPVAVLEAAYHWLADGGDLLAERAGNARRLGRPRAAFEIAEIAWQAAQAGVVSQPAAAPRLVNLSELASRLEEELKKLRERIG